MSRPSGRIESNFGRGSDRLPYWGGAVSGSDKPIVYDALEIPDAEVVLVTKLIGGQRATVLPANIDETGVETALQPVPI